MRRSFIVLVVVLACSHKRKVPAEVQAAIEAVRPDARLVAEVAARECAAQIASGRFEMTPTSCSLQRLPGEKDDPTAVSPAKGTPLETNHAVLDVVTVCYSPRTVSGPHAGVACGMSFSPLRGAKLPSTHYSQAESDHGCTSTSTECEDVTFPSKKADDEKSADLVIVKSIPGTPTASVEVTVILANK